MLLHWVVGWPFSLLLALVTAQSLIRAVSGYFFKSLAPLFENSEK